jgi:hypothetical protein
MALTTMVLAGIPAGFMLALVIATSRVEARYVAMQRDPLTAAAETQLFSSEGDAVRWLTEDDETDQ